MTLSEILDVTAVGVHTVAVDVRKPNGDYCRQTYDILAAYDAPSIKLLADAEVTCVGMIRDAEGEAQLYLRVRPA